MEKTIKGATKIKLAAPKSKYIDSILSATRGGETGVAEIFRTLQLRLRDSTWTIVFKSLIVVHFMIRDGGPEVTLKFLAQSPKSLAISQFTEVQTQGVTIRRYYEYLFERVKAYQDTQTDFVLNGSSKIRSLTIEKGLLRHAETVQNQIRALIRCDPLNGAETDNEIAMTAFRLLVMDLLELYKVMNEATIKVLEQYFAMSKVDAQRALEIYKTFARQTDQVVQYLSIARQYATHTRLDVPKLKHAPTTLTSSLEEYLNDPDFEDNRRQYLNSQQAKRTGRPMPSNSTPTKTPSKAPPTTQMTAPTLTASASKPAPKGPAPDLIDFFESIEQNREPIAQATYPPVQGQNPYSQQPIQQYPQSQQQFVPQQTGYNPFLQQQPTPQIPQEQQTPQPLRPDFTGAGFGGYGPQPSQAQPQAYQFSQALQSMPENGVADYQQQSAFNQPAIQSPQPLQAQPTSTNPFRQSMQVQSTGSPFGSRQSTNPFAKQSNSIDNSQLSQQQTTQPQPQSQSLFNSSIPEDQPYQLPSQAQPQPAQILPQRTGTNPFAKSPPPTTTTTTNGFQAAQPLSVNVTGSTNPFRQSAFVNQQTGLGWQHTANQGTFSGMDVNAIQTSNIFPRPGVAG